MNDAMQISYKELCALCENCLKTFALNDEKDNEPVKNHDAYIDIGRHGKYCKVQVQYKSCQLEFF